MFFLFNDVVFDIGDPRSHALETGIEHGYEENFIKAMRTGQVLKLVRQAIIEDRDLARNRPGVAAFLSALLAWKTNDANALLALPAVNATTQAQVVTRLASLSLVAMAQLSNQQTLGKLNFRVVNSAVWAQIALKAQSA